MATLERENDVYLAINNGKRQVSSSCLSWILEFQNYTYRIYRAHMEQILENGCSPGMAEI